MKKSRFRIVPIVHASYGACWALKENDTQIATFLKKQQAEARKNELETKLLADFLLSDTSNQELKIEL